MVLSILDVPCIDHESDTQDARDLMVIAPAQPRVGEQALGCPIGQGLYVPLSKPPRADVGDFKPSLKQPV